MKQITSVVAVVFALSLGNAWGDTTIPTQIHSYNYNTDFADSVGTSTGSATGNAAITTTGGIGDSGYLSLTGGYLTLANSTGTAFGVDKTISASMWTKTTDTAKWSIIFANGSWSAGNNQGFRFSNNGGTANRYETYVNAADGTNRLDLSVQVGTFQTGANWQFIATSVDVNGKSWVYYGRQNGYFISNVMDSAKLGDASLIPNNAWHVGSDGVNNYKYTGDVDELNVWNTQLNIVQMFRLYNGGLKGMSTDQILASTPATSTSVAGGWASDATWGGTCSPLGGESVTVAHEVTFSQDTTIMSDVTLVDGGKFNFNQTNWLSFSNMNYTQNGGSTVINSNLFNVGNNSFDETNITVNSGSFNAGVMRLASNKDKNGQTNMTASLTLAGDSTFSSKYFIAGMGSNNNASITVKDNATAQFNQTVLLGVDNASGTMTIQDNANVTFNVDLWVASVGQGSDDYKNGVGVLNVNGGTTLLKGKMVVGEKNNCDGTVNINSGSLTVQGQTTISYANTKGKLNVSGGDITMGSLTIGNNDSLEAILNKSGTQGSMTVSALTMNAKGVANFYIGNDGIAPITVTGAANLAGTINALTAGGATPSSSREYILINAGSISNFTPISGDVWSTRAEGNQVIAFLNEASAVAQNVLDPGVETTIPFATERSTGWFSSSPKFGWTGDLDVSFTLNAMPSGDDVDGLLSWINQGLAGNEGLLAAYTDDGIAITGLSFEDTPDILLTWDLESYNIAHGTDFAYTAMSEILTNAREVPEPTSWALVLMGMVALLVFRRKK